MGAAVEIVAIEVIYNGLIQMDVKWEDDDGTEKGLRIFIEPAQLMTAIGNGMQKAWEDYMAREMEEYDAE